MYCRHCPDHEHQFVCNCGHHHNLHNYGGGCRSTGCSCEGYNQSMGRLPGEEWPRKEKAAVAKRHLPKRSRYRV
jgi:hypothetical protein